MSDIPKDPSGKPYFNIPRDGWGSGWKAGPVVIIEQYEPRFVPASLMPALLECWRMTAVGSKHWRSNRADRMLQAVDLFMQQHPDVSRNGAYKDLSGALELP